MKPITSEELFEKLPEGALKNRLSKALRSTPRGLELSDAELCLMVENGGLSSPKEIQKTIAILGVAVEEIDDPRTPPFERKRLYQWIAGLKEDLLAMNELTARQLFDEQ